MEGAKHNLPDADAQKAAEGIKQLASELREEDILLVLISGNNSTSTIFFNKMLLQNVIFNTTWFISV